MKRLLITLAAFGFLAKGTAQVKFQIALMPDKKTYLVSMKPDQTWVYPNNITSTAQVTLRIPANAKFTAGNITSLQTGTRWLDNAYVERPAADSNSTYVSFALVSLGVPLPYVSGVETPLFSFKNLQNGCVGRVELIDNNSSTIAQITAQGFNIKNHIATFGSKGRSAFLGINEAVTDCSTATSAKEMDKTLQILSVYPIPAADRVTIEWQNVLNATAQNTVFVVTDVLGKTVYSQKIGPLSIKGIANKIEVDVADWAEGVYLFRFVSEVGGSEMSKFLVIR